MKIKKCKQPTSQIFYLHLQIMKLLVIFIAIVDFRLEMNEKFAFELSS